MSAHAAVPVESTPALALRVERAVVDRGGVRILDDVNLALPAGSVALCTGPNGAGKTTLLRALAGLVRLTSGALVVAEHARIELVGHTEALHPDLTLAENLDVIARLVQAPPPAIVAALDHVGLAAAADRRAGRCSAGMRRRVAFARLRLTRPDLLLLDEPDVALDRDARLLVEDAIAATLQRGGAVVVATHAPERLDHLATTRWLLRDGRVTT